ncbi:nitrilase-related carbon-nitrogen hydrolase [Piscirickettsia salmonis]|uniref:nitrilase-related carbon-nitrogen hydrolase n=1 Tax=Piscirickettsia salmonis TaxID=1238 RepID=UPI0007D81F49|nr:Apolipoprotein N-acyltransferase [Piscirickettsiaceae bacterium NZ-RLO1]
MSIGLISVNTQSIVYDKGAIALSQHYLQLIQQVAKEGAQFIVSPEKFIRVTENTYQKIIPLFQHAAKENHVTLILGIARLNNKDKFNSAIIINSKGKVIGVYNKHHLLPGLESQFTSGKHFFNVQNKFKWGVAICKDMDFLTLGRHYGKTHTQLLLVPALDFNIDAWYHGRSAIMRGVENGFAVARSAAHGYLSITDQMGRIINMTPDFHKENNVLEDTISLYPIHTFYSEWGNWFAWTVLSLLILAIVRITLRLKR